MAEFSLPFVISRSEAKRLGRTRYFTGKPCKRGHVSERDVLNLTCVTCSSEARKTKYCEKIRVSSAAWKKNNKERNLAAKRDWEKRNRKLKPKKVELSAAEKRERDFRKLRNWRKTNPEQYRVQKNRRRCREFNAEGSHTAEDIRQLHSRQGGRCANLACRISFQKCGYHVDHVMPLSRGGSNWPDNLQLLCPKCNVRKNAKHPQRWASDQGILFA
jgi:5-methylcytosine-specific restriction endonuclease McrA